MPGPSSFCTPMVLEGLCLKSQVRGGSSRRSNAKGGTSKLESFKEEQEGTDIPVKADLKSQSPSSYSAQPSQRPPCPTLLPTV